MGRSKEFNMVVPVSLIKDLDDYLIAVNKSNMNRYYFYYIINKILLLQSSFRNQEYFNLNLSKMEKAIVWNIRSYVNVLKEGGFIMSDNEYRRGFKSIYYKLSDDYLSMPVLLGVPKDELLSKKISREMKNRKTHDSRLPVHLRKMKTQFKIVDINMDLASVWIKENFEESVHAHSLASLNAISDYRTLYFKRSKTNGRLDTNLTNMKKELRKFVLKGYVGIDLVNSQPFLLSVIISNLLDNGLLCLGWVRNMFIESFGITSFSKIDKIRQNAEIEDLANVESFLESCSNGTFYEYFMTKFDNGLSRDYVKEIIMMVLYSRNKIIESGFIPFKDDKEIFKNCFPLVYRIIHVLKNKRHNELAIFLQKVESRLFIDVIAKKLIDIEIIPFTIHDSIYVKESDLGITVGLMEQCFIDEVGIKPKFKIDYLR